MERVNERLGKVDDGKSYTDSRILVQLHKVNNIFFSSRSCFHALQVIGIDDGKKLRN